MPRIEDLMAGVSEWSVVATAVNGIATATKAADPTLAHVVTGYSISASAAVAAAVTATLSEGATVREQLEIPAATIAPILANRKFRLAENQKAELVLPALGAAVRGTVVVHGFSRKV